MRDGSYSCGAHSITYRDVESCYTPATNVRLCVSYTKKKVVGKKGKERGRGRGEGGKGEASRPREWCSTSRTTGNLLDTGGGVSYQFQAERKPAFLKSGL